MNSRVALALIALLQPTFGTFAYADAPTEAYVVKDRDTLSQIIQREMTGPEFIYGRNGKLEQLAKLNPRIKDPNFIHPGQIVIMPVDIGLVDRYLAGFASRTLANDPVTPAPSPMLAEAPVTLPVVAPPAPIAPVTVIVAPTPPLAPAPAAKLVPVAPVANADDDFDKMQVHADVSFLYNRVDARDIARNSDAVFISDLVPQLQLGLTTYFSPAWSLDGYVQARHLQFVPPRSGQTVKNPGLVTEVGAVVSNQISDRLRVRGEVGVDQRVFARAISANQYTFDKAPVMFFGAGFDAALWQNLKSTLGVRGDVRSLSAAKTTEQDVQSGISGRGELFWRRQRRSYILEQGFYFEKSSQNTAIIEQETTEIGLNLKVLYDF